MRVPGRIKLDPLARPQDHILGVWVSQEPQLAGHVSSDQGLSWFDPGDPFHNRLECHMAPFGDDLMATVFWGGLPVMLVTGGFTRDDGEYEAVVPEYRGYRNLQHVQAIFHERIVGDLPSYGSDGDHYLENTGYEHPASVLVVEDGQPELYELAVLMQEKAGDEGHSWVQMMGLVARAMYAADPESLKEPVGF